MAATDATHVLVETRPQRAYAVQWVYTAMPPEDVCPEGCVIGRRKIEVRKERIGGPHVHLPNGGWALVHVGDWIVRAADGSFVEILDNETFQRNYRLALDSEVTVQP